MHSDQENCQSLSNSLQKFLSHFLLNMHSLSLYFKVLLTKILQMQKLTHTVYLYDKKNISFQLLHSFKVHYIFNLNKILKAQRAGTIILLILPYEETEIQTLVTCQGSQGSHSWYRHKQVISFSFQIPNLILLLTPSPNLSGRQMGP